MTDKISTINKIVTASIELFANKSYANTTLQDISKSSGAAIGSIYHAFPKGKSVIAELITERYFQEYKQNLLTLLKTDLAGQSFEKLIDDLFDILLSLNSKYPCLYDPTFEIHKERLMAEGKKLDDELDTYITLMIQIKNPNITREQAVLKTQMTTLFWNSFLAEYQKTKNIQILEQLKIITLQYLNN
jgi:AcrR family transcriptional regulator